MKTLICVLTLLLTLAACSKEEPVTSEVAAVPADKVNADVDVVDSNTGDDSDAVAADETPQVVEESAADAAADDKTILLARADDTTDAARNWQFKEGAHYTRMIPTQPIVGGADKIEVAEVFMYSCSHCRTLEAYINPWAETKSADVRFVRIPAAFNRLGEMHAQLYYTEEVLGRNGLIKEPDKFRAMVFDEIHSRGNRLASEESILKLFARGGVSEDDFRRTWSSFEVNQKLLLAADLNRRYNVDSVPMVVVNGKYRTDAGSAGSYPKLIELIDELTVREGLR